jgi:hypothetical protein
MWAFLSHIATLAAFALLWWRIEPKVFAIVKRFEIQDEVTPVYASPRPSLEEALEAEEYEAIPQELYNLAMQESESWAREQSLAAMIQLKQRLKSWDRVRAFYESKDVN